MKDIFNCMLSLVVLSTSPLYAAPLTTEYQPSQTMSPEILQTMVSEAISHFEQTPRHHWSYRISNYENEEGVEQFNPQFEKNSSWKLLSINGEVPTEEQLQDFQAGKKPKDNDDKNNNFKLRLSDLIVEESLQLDSHNGDVLWARFNVNLTRLGQEASNSLKGKLAYNKELQFIELIEITNSQSFSPMFSAKITDFKMTLNFTKMEDSVLPKEYQLNMKGYFAFFTQLEEESRNTFSDYKYLGGQEDLSE